MLIFRFVGWIMILWLKLILLPGYLLLKVLGLAAKVIFSIGALAVGIVLVLLAAGLTLAIILGDVLACVIAVVLIVGFIDAYLGLLAGMLAAVLTW